MGKRGRPQPTFTEEEKAEIKKELNKKQSQAVFKRLMILQMKIDGIASPVISEKLEFNNTAINKVVSRYKKEGMQYILGKNYRGNRRHISYEEESKFLSGYEKRAESGEILEVKEIWVAYEQLIGKKVNKSVMYTLLARHKWRKVMPRSEHPKKAKPEEIEAYKKNQG